jgi:hypothetical protein
MVARWTSKLLFLTLGSKRNDAEMISTVSPLGLLDACADRRATWYESSTGQRVMGEFNGSEMIWHMNAIIDNVRRMDLETWSREHPDSEDYEDEYEDEYDDF